MCCQALPIAIESSGSSLISPSTLIALSTIDLTVGTQRRARLAYFLILDSFFAPPLLAKALLSSKTELAASTVS